MIGPRTRLLLLRCYPPAWRARYGEELDALMADCGTGPRTSLRVCLDVLLAAGRERLRASGLVGDGVPPEQRSRAGTLLVLCAWTAFALAGAAVQKVSEHWQQATPTALRGPPAAAFHVLVAAAATGSLLVLAGVALAAPSFVAYLRRGGWRELRRPIARACALSLVAAGATVALIVLAHRLSVPQRNGADFAYEMAFLIWAFLAASCVMAWAAAAVAAGTRIPLSERVVRLEARLAAGVALAMAVVTVATAAWCTELADAAPGFFAGQPPGSPGTELPPVLAAVLVLMLAATAVASAGAVRAVRASR